MKNYILPENIRDTIKLLLLESKNMPITFKELYNIISSLETLEVVNDKKSDDKS